MLTPSSSLRLLLQLALLSSNYGQKLLAEDIFTGLVKCYSYNPKVHAVYITHLVNAGRIDEALVHIRAAKLELGVSDALDLAESMVYFLMGDDSSVEILDRLKSSHDSSISKAAESILNIRGG